MQTLINLPALMLIVAANGMPVPVAKVLGKRCAAPVDGGHVLKDGRPLFGSHKTWRGLVAGIAAAGILGAVLHTGFAVGASFGALALAGDLTSSFLKRRLDRAGGQSVPLLDQLPEALAPMLILRNAMHLDAISIIGTAAVFTLLDLIVAKLFR